MTIYELFIQSEADDVRVEVPLDGLNHAVTFYRRLGEMADSGVGTLTESSGSHIIVDHLTVADANRLLEGVDTVWLGRPGKPGRDLSIATVAALKRFSADASLEAMYWEI